MVSETGEGHSYEDRALGVDATVPVIVDRDSEEMVGRVTRAAISDDAVEAVQGVMSGRGRLIVQR